MPDAPDHAPDHPLPPSAEQLARALAGERATITRLITHLAYATGVISVHDTTAGEALQRIIDEELGRLTAAPRRHPVIDTGPAESTGTPEERPDA